MIGSNVVEGYGGKERRDMGETIRERIESSCVFNQTQRLDQVLRERVIGQDEALEALVADWFRRHK